MTQEEMDLAAHQLLLQEQRSGQPLTYQLLQAAETTDVDYQPLQEQPSNKPV